MRVKVGDKVVNRYNEKGVVQEVSNLGCFVNYGEFAKYEHYMDLQKVRKPRVTLKQADKAAQREQEAEMQAQNLVKEFCESLAKVGKK